ncbi:class II peroxidase [Sphaerobolus stellatus SS14]|uniref:Peroxidase n=1 Tax=Sphaerobolus stellatus (strain SS14) TaxID=990650 RepID=A0A0C9V1N9_SPHS4|nr:class II peroxidase [Sphaerobolus stellatus SS14]
MRVKLILQSLLVICFLKTIPHVAAAVTCPGGPIVQNARCCDLVPVLKDLQANLTAGDVCNGLARSTLRLAFHDAMGFSNTVNMGGGADGSVLTFHTIEMGYAANVRLDLLVSILQSFVGRHNISTGDFLHFAAAYALTTCPGAPGLSFFYGRPPPTVAAPDNTIPLASDPINHTLARFLDVGFTPPEVVALLAAHSIASSSLSNIFNIVPTMDSTPLVFDNQFFKEVLLPGNFPNNSVDPNQTVASPFSWEIRLKSDAAFAAAPQTSAVWQGFINSPSSLIPAFSQAMSKMSLIGYQSSNLVDCSDLVPIPSPAPSTSTTSGTNPPQPTL